MKRIVQNGRRPFKSTSIQVAGIKVELQEPAIKDLEAAIAEANAAGVKISPNGNDRKHPAELLPLPSDFGQAALIRL